jgi:hypothetical protein
MNDYLTGNSATIINIQTNVLIMTGTPERENNYTGQNLVYVLTIQFKKEVQDAKL